ncbi:TolC family protein [Acidihalobacter yilgarnensis]|uniref:TolC family protein n=1 Tax=Acidihalobacter yilgarnensis TaxID=2819280 RepID=UPI0018D34616|nr:TolC family protein [Acidihalobacter yilgarnensis]
MIQYPRIFRRWLGFCVRNFRLLVVFFKCLLGLGLLFDMTLANADTLSLKNAEVLLIRDNPSLAMATQRILALQHLAKAAGQLADPQLSLRAVNVPTDSFSLSQQPMTLLRLGVAQTFPPFGKLGLMDDRIQARAFGQRYARETKHAELVFGLRRAWVSAVYLQYAQETVRRQKTLAHESVLAAMAAFRSGMYPQSDVLRARLAMENLSNDESALAADEATDIASIAQYIGIDQVPIIVHKWPELPSAYENIEKHLFSQPILREAQVKVRAAQFNLQIAKKNYLPTVTIDASYGKSFFPGSPDYFSVGISMTLPIFSGDRINQTVDSANAQVMVAKFDERNQQLALSQQVRSATAKYTSLSEKLARMETKILPLARAGFQSTLAAYTSGNNTMSAVLEAQQAVLASELQTLQYRRDQLIEQAKLDYLATSSQEQP